MVLFSRTHGYKQLGRASLPLTIINVNEPLIFGIPIFFNPVMVIPFLCIPLMGFLLAYAATLMGLVPVLQEQVGWMMPPLINSWIASGGSWAAVLLQVVIIILGVAIYWPFFRWMESRSEGPTAALTGLIGFNQADSKLDVSGSQSHYVSQMRNNFRAHAEVEALQQTGDFILYFQPQVRLSDGCISGAEVLLRHKSHTDHVSPPTFLASFQQLGLMAEMDFWVIEHAVIAARQISPTQPFVISINLSPQTLIDPRLGKVLDRILTAPLPHHLTLEVEITENQAINNSSQFLANLNALSARGLKVALDDFGSGYSTLSYLTDYKFDKIKLDRSLVLATATTSGQQFFNSTVALCQTCCTTIVAEGVETEQQLQLVTASGVGIVQGFYFHRPMPLSALLDTLSNSAKYSA